MRGCAGDGIFTNTCTNSVSASSSHPCPIRCGFYGDVYVSPGVSRGIFGRTRALISPHPPRSSVGVGANLRTRRRRAGGSARMHRLCTTLSAWIYIYIFHRNTKPPHSFPGSHGPAEHSPPWGWRGELRAALPGSCAVFQLLSALSGSAGPGPSRPACPEPSRLLRRAAPAPQVPPAGICPVRPQGREGVAGAAGSQWGRGVSSKK